MKKTIAEIKAYAKIFEKFSEEDLKKRVEKIKKQTKNKSLTNILPEWFAIVQEISYRSIGLRHFESQLLAGIFLNEGKIVEMKTGEGKTLVSSLPASLNALTTSSGVHLVTVNEYLAERDQKWMGKIYENLNLTVGLIKNGDSLQKKQKNYLSDITYVTNSELVFDFLRDNASHNLKDLVQAPLNFCLIDEIDSILIDEARTPLVLSSLKEKEKIQKLYLGKILSNILQKDLHFEIDEKRKDISLTDKGYKIIKILLSKKSLYDIEDPWMLEILNALKAKYLFKRNKDYIIFNNKIAIVDEFTGRIMEDRKWSLGIHEAIELKENLESQGGNKNKTAITYQNFFSLYPKLCGMTGTGKTAEKEFKDIYNLKVFLVPTNKKVARNDLNDLVYQNELSKWKAVLEKSKECFSKGQPLLIGTTSIEKSEFLSELFSVAKIPHQVLNAKAENINRESQIVAQAGKRFAVTIATNMAGRGTDIILGGNISFEIKEKIKNLLANGEKTDYLEEINLIRNDYLNDSKALKKNVENLPYSLDKCKNTLAKLYKKLYKNYFEIWQKENQFVKDLGGLFVLGTERHENRRIDNQLRGRSGRQGDPGYSQFFISLEDDLIKIFGGEGIKKWVSYLINNDEALESQILSKSLENAQKKVEEYNYEIRKNVFEYDNIINSQRKILFFIRRSLLEKSNYEEIFLRYLESLDKKRQSENYQKIWIKFDRFLSKKNLYQKALPKISKSEKLLELIDFYWTEHIERMNYVKDTINWKAYGQLNPLIEYNLQAIKSFNWMFEEIRQSMVYYFLEEPSY
jgi:preprotein translocase subunit SecA